MTWTEAVRMCGMYRGSATALSLYSKAKRGCKLSPSQIEWVYRYAEMSQAKYGDRNVVVTGEITIPPSITVRASWLIDGPSGKVLGRIGEDGKTATLYVNGIIHPLDLRRKLRCPTEY
jgi:hypothetical protein